MQLNEQTLKHSALGAAILTCGIGSEARLEQSMGMGRTALNMGALRLANLDELDDDETVISASVVGRALDKNGKLTIELREVFRSVELLLETEERRPRAVINGHPGGFLHWLLAAYFDLDVLDAYANGRGHPTLAMGGLGLARPGSAIFTATTLEISSPRPTSPSPCGRTFSQVRKGRKIDGAREYCRPSLIPTTVSV